MALRRAEHRALRTQLLRTALLAMLGRLRPLLWGLRRWPLLPVVRAAVELLRLQVLRAVAWALLQALRVAAVVALALHALWGVMIQR